MGSTRQRRYTPIHTSNKVPKDEEMAKFYHDLKASEALHATTATIIQGTSTPPSNTEPVMLPQPSDSAKRDSSTPSDQTKKKRKVESVAISKKPAAQLEKWATKRQELKGEKPQPPALVDEENDVSEFADLKQMCCLLCKRKFQSIQEIQKHERLSALHKSNLQDDTLRNATLAKIRGTAVPTESAAAYRDRARERRIQFNQPHHPDLPHPNPRIAAKQAAAKVPSPEPERVNKGAKLLAAMGWTQGSGLGAEGTGIVEPIKAEGYAEGVGLGAGAVKVVGEEGDDGSYRAYVRKVRDVARGRYEDLEVKEGE
jgi:RNA-binding protein 5/10